MLKMAVVGKDVSRSLSPKMHKFIVEHMGERCTYDAISLSPESFDEKIEEILSAYDFFNVTIPFKLDVMKHLMRIEGDAKVFGAVNTVCAKERAGYNTDGMGFMLSLACNGVDMRGRKALVVGTGGVGRSVIYKLAEAGASVFASEKSPERLKEVWDELGCFTPLAAAEPDDYDLVLNCTGVGMHKSVGLSPVGEELLSRCRTAYDLIYEPKESEFLRIAKNCGKKTINGEGMLFYQAYYADCIFLGKAPDEREAKRLFEAYTEEL